MNLVLIANVAVVIILLFFLRSGYKQGFLIKLLSILSFFIVGFLAWWLSSFLDRFLSIYPKNATPFQGTPLEGVLYGNLNRLFIFVLLFVLFNLVVMCLRPLFKMVGAIPIVSTFNKIAGCVLGGAQGLLLLVLVTMVLRIPFWEEGNVIASTSLLQYTDPIANAALFYMKEPMQQLEKVENALNKKEKLSTSDIETIRTWMLQQHIDKEKVDEFISTLRT